MLALKFVDVDSDGTKDTTMAAAATDRQDLETIHGNDANDTAITRHFGSSNVL